VAGRSRKDAPTDQLVQRLEELARAIGRSDVRSGEAERLLELAAVATVHAAALEVLTNDRAGELWASAADRHRPANR